MLKTRVCWAGAIAASVILLALGSRARADVDGAPEGDASVDASADDSEASDSATTEEEDASESDASDAGATVPDAGPRDAPADVVGDAVLDAPPPYDAGDGLTPLNELPTWSPEEDHYGCSCRLGALRGTEGVAVAGSCILAAVVLIRRRRTNG